MTSLQIQARALGDPTRFGIFRYLLEAPGPVDVAELTEHLGLNHNAIRQHLAKLVDARLVLENAAAPSGRGRPRLLYTPDPRADSRWGATSPYERLSMLLAEVLRSGDRPEEVGRRAGLRQRLGTAPLSGDPVEEFVQQMASHGFDPSACQQGAKLDVTLQCCPFASAALTDPDTVCALHLGLARGLAEAVGGIVVDELLPRDPRGAHCRLRCRLTDDDTAPRRS